MDMQLRGAMIDPAGGIAPPSTSAAIEQLVQIVRRQLYVLIAGPALAILCALVYLLVTPAVYTATATLLIDSSPLQVLQTQQQQQLGEIPLDTIQVGSQVEVIESDNVALAVIRKLKLTEDPEFVKNAAPPSPSDSRELIEGREREALEKFEGHRSVQRLEKSYGLDVSFTSVSPTKAAKIANAIADGYIDDQLESKDLTRRRAGAWFQERIDALSAQMTAADRAVLDFKEKNKIVDVQNASQGTPGQLIGDQQLVDLNTQLGVARGVTSEARARLDRIEEIRKSDISQAAGADTLKNDVITRLRNQYLDLSAREANISARYGSDHFAAINLRNQMADISHNIQSELGRVAASYQSDYEIAKSREQRLERDLANQVQEGQVTSRDKLGLAELESSAKAYHTIYNSFLQRYTDVTQQQSFPITEARIISPAAPPSRKSKPNGALSIAIALTMGLIMSFGVAALREANDGVFRTSRQAEQCLQVACLAVIPLLAESPAPTRPWLAWRRQPDENRPAPSGGKLVEAVPADRTDRIAFSKPILRYVADYPLSQFAEAIRGIKMSVQLQAAVSHKIQVIGVTSAVPNEGKSTIACNLALLMAGAGKRVILLDADLRNPSLAPALLPKPAAGLLEVLNGKITLEQAIGTERSTGLSLLPFVLDEPLAHADETLSSQIFKDIIDRLRKLYDYVIVDLPPVAPVVDVRAALPVIDSLVFVLEWGSTRIGAVQRYLATPEIRERLLGIALNKANLKDLQQFDIRGLHHDGYYANLGYNRTTKIDA